MNVNIREANSEDIKNLLPITRAFHHAANFHSYSGWDPDKWLSWITYCIESDDAVCLLAMNGTEIPIGWSIAAAVPAYWDKDVRICQEAVLWTVPEYRKQGVGTLLIEKMLEWGKEKDCVVAAISAQQSMAPRKTAIRYKKMGFELTEKAFTRRL